jgi:hypothetical protein
MVDLRQNTCRPGSCSGPWVGRSRQKKGGLSSATRRALHSIAKGKLAKRAIPRKSAAGVHLVREWNGRTYQVEVLETGFRMDDREYASLTAIAKKITGANWSGPRFFGLTGH